MNEWAGGCRRDPILILCWCGLYPYVVSWDRALSFPWLSSHLRYPPFSSHVISFLASFAVFCPTQSRLQREEGAVGVGSRQFFLPWLLKPGLQPLSWDALQVMQGQGAGRDPPGEDMGLGRGHAAGFPAEVGLLMEIMEHRLAQPLAMLWEPTGSCCDPAPQLDADPEPYTPWWEFGCQHRVL